MGFTYGTQLFQENLPKTYFLTSWLRQQSAKDPNPAAEKKCLHLSICYRKPSSCNRNIYHFHVVESLNLDFFDLKGVVGGLKAGFVVMGGWWDDWGSSSKLGGWFGRQRGWWPYPVKKQQQKKHMEVLQREMLISLHVSQLPLPSSKDHPRWNYTPKVIILAASQ